MLKAHPLVEEDRNKIAIQRRPVVYCLEACDLPQDVDMDEVYLPRDAQFTSRFQPEMLGGIMAVHTQAVQIPEKDWERAFDKIITLQHYYLVMQVY